MISMTNMQFNTIKHRALIVCIIIYYFKRTLIQTGERKWRWCLTKCIISVKKKSVPIINQ